MSGFHEVGWPHAVVFMTVVWLILVYLNREPSVKSIKYLLSALNDRGGNILVLLVLTIMFFRAAMELFYFGLNGHFDGKDPVLLLGLGFVTGTAFGGAFSAMIKTMSPQNARAEVPAPRPTDGIQPPKPQP